MDENKIDNIEKEFEKYQSRIVEVEYDVDPKTLNPNPYNFKLHQQPQKDTMEDVFSELGVIDGIKASIKTRNVIDGHMRTQMFLEKKQNIPLVIWLDLDDEEEERKAIILFDEVGDLARINRDMLAKILSETRLQEQKTRELAERMAKKKHIDIDIDKATGVIDAVAKKDDGDKEEIDNMFDNLIEKWDVENHFIWRFGEDLYVIKGDAHSKEIKDVIKSYNPDCILTDPPYGIDVVGSDGRIGLAKHFGDIEGDTEPFDPEHILEYNLPSIIWGANHFSSKLPDFPQLLVWNKKGVGNQSNDFADAEIAWCSEKGVVRIFDHVWRGAARASERNIPRVHPTQKPIALFEWCIENFLIVDRETDKKRKMILDLYGGSGTILIAAQKFNNFGGISVDRDKRYIAVTLERLFNSLQRKEKPKVIA